MFDGTRFLFTYYVQGRQKATEQDQYHGHQCRNHEYFIVQVRIETVADRILRRRRIEYLLQVSAAQSALCTVDGIDCNECRWTLSVGLRFLKAAWNFQQHVGLVFLDGLQAFCIRRRKCRQLKITRSFDAVHQSFGRRTAVVIDDGNAQVLYFQCGSPGHDQHHHAGKKQDEAGQETVAFQLLEFFFYQVT